MSSKGTGLGERFWSKVQKGNEGECWVWTAALDSDGYGRFRLNGRSSRRAHRVSYESVNGPIPEGMHSDHLCRNRACVNPSHLEMVSPSINTKRGQKNRIGDAETDRIVEMFRSGLNTTEIATRLGVSRTRVYGIMRENAPEALKKNPRRKSYKIVTFFCKRQHFMSRENTYVRPDGRKVCRTCRRESRAKAS